MWESDRKNMKNQISMKKIEKNEKYNDIIIKQKKQKTKKQKTKEYVEHTPNSGSSSGPVPPNS